MKLKQKSNNWANNLNNLDMYIGQRNERAVIVMIEVTTSKNIGEKGLAFLVNSHLIGWVRDISTGQIRCKLPELQEVAKTLYQEWANNLSTLDRYIERGAIAALGVLGIVESTTSKNVSEKGLAFLVNSHPEWIRDISIGQIRCKLPELQEVAKTLYQDWMKTSQKT